MLRTTVRALANRVRLVEHQVRSSVLRLQNRNLRPAFAAQSHLTIPERVTLYRLAQSQKVICEIGSYVGASACCFGAAVGQKGSGKILCIDTWQNDAMSEGNRDTFAEFTANTAAYRRYIVPIRGWSTKVIDEVRSHCDYLDVLFIDGDHSYDGVKADWDHYKAFLRPGSTVVFHDCGWAEGVQRVIEEEAKPRVGSFNSLPNMWWGVLTR